jgi:GNAT superfamily N-acetyltransferase
MQEQFAQIHEATRGDAAVIARLVSEAFGDVAAQFEITPQNCPTFPAFCRPEWIAEGFDKGSRFFVAAAEDKPAGCVGMTDPKDGSCDLVRLAVPPGYRHKGLGSLLIEHIMAQARTLGLGRVDLAIVARNDRLLHWYKRNGFAVTHKKWLPHLPFEVAYMSRGLKP